MILRNVNHLPTVTDHTNAGSCNCNTMMKPMATRMSAKLTSTMRQHTPLVLGQNGLGADMVSTTTPALVVLFPALDVTWLLPLLELLCQRTQGTSLYDYHALCDRSLPLTSSLCPVWKTDAATSARWDKRLWCCDGIGRSSAGGTRRCRLVD